MTFIDPRHDDEIRHHIEERVDRLVAEGMDPEQARRTAEAAFGDLSAVREELDRIDRPRPAPLRAALERVATDVGFALRQFRRNAGFTLVAVLTLALGIGASAAIFALVKAVVLDPLPYPEADRLVVLQQVTPDGQLFSVSELDFRDFRERIGSLEFLTAVSNADFATPDDGRPRQVRAVAATGDFFPLFGVRPVLGRGFTESESGAGAARLVVLSHAFWQSHTAADPDVVGTVLPLDGLPFEVVGVAQPGWNPTREADVWIPMELSSTERDNHDLSVMGRRAEGVELERAQADAARAATELAALHPATNGDWGVRLTPLKERIVGAPRSRASRMLLGAVGLLLLMACASVSNLMLARGSLRRREIGLRAALGAGWGRLAQQLLTESLVLAGAGAVLGVVLAWALVPALQAVSPPDTPRLDQVAIDGAVLAFAVLTALTTGVLFGFAPLVHLLGGQPGPGTSGERVTGSGAADALRHVLVAGQVALSFTLLFGAAALGMSFLRLQNADPGMPVDDVMVVPLMLSGDRYSMAERRVARERISDAVAALPGVAAVGLTNIRPFTGANTMVSLNAEGVPATPEDAPFVRWRGVSPGFFDALGMTPEQGRTLTPPDFDDGAEAVVVVTASLARLLFGTPDAAVGRRVAMGWDGRNYQRVVGVVPDLEDIDVATSSPAGFFLPDPGMLPWSIVLVRSVAGATPPSATRLREAIWSVEPGLPIPTVEPLSDSFAATTAGSRFNMLVVAAFAGSALVLSLLGIYGLVLFSVRRRTREIGVRMALGARPRGVVRMVVSQGARLTAAGLAAGVALTVLLAGFLDALLYETPALSPLYLGGVALLLGSAGLLATWLPASRATRIDPTDALRAD